MPEPRRVLTREDYEDAIDKAFHEAKEIARQRLGVLSRRLFRAQALKRWDERAPVYGPCDLTLRNWEQEGNEELIDLIAYLLFRIVQKERGL